jgi:hypothetical protein
LSRHSPALEALRVHVLVLIWLRNLNPGGYLELCELLNPLQSDDGTLKEDSALLKWNNLLVEASDKLGPSLRSALHYKQQLTDAGFEDVTQIEFKWPLNPWPRDAKYKELGKRTTVPRRIRPTNTAGWLRR